MSVKTIILMCAALTLAAPVSATEYTRLNAKQLTKHYAGQTELGEYSNYTSRSDTVMYTEIHNEDGTIAYKEGDFSSTGIWYVTEKDQICYRYNEANGLGRAQCFWIYEADGCYYSFSRKPALLKKTPERYERWGSRGVIKGSGHTCAALVI